MFNSASDYLEPVLTTVLLPRCERCRAPHPLACAPVPANPTICPRCAAPVPPPGAPVTTKAVVTGLAGVLLAIGRFFRRIEERLKP